MFPPYCHSRAMTRESRSHEYRIESGRSMVEMLGTLAIMGVLSIGGIMGYSYAMDRYHANQIMNDVNLRGIDLIAQASRGGGLSLAEWPAKTSGDLDIGLEIDETTNTTEGGIYVKGVEKDICEIIADDLLPEDITLVIDGETYVSGTCGETNKMVFYYDAMAEALGGEEPECNGPVVDGKCEPCEEGLIWNTSTNTCMCASNTEFLSDGKCYPCPSGTTVSESGKECVCPPDFPNWEGLRGDSGACSNDYKRLDTRFLCADGLIYTYMCCGGNTLSIQTPTYGCKPEEFCTSLGSGYHWNTYQVSTDDTDVWHCCVIPNCGSGGSND